MTPDKIYQKSSLMNNMGYYLLSLISFQKQKYKKTTVLKNQVKQLIIKTFLYLCTRINNKNYA